MFNFSTSHIVATIPAPSGLIAVYAHRDGTETREPVVAIATVEASDRHGRTHRTVQALVVELDGFSIAGEIEGFDRLEMAVPKC